LKNLYFYKTYKFLNLNKLKSLILAPDERVMQALTHVSQRKFWYLIIKKLNSQYFLAYG